jgi:hypothetical protein
MPINRVKNLHALSLTAARNLAILRKVAINLMGQDRTTRISMRARRKQAAWNDDYMLALLAG